jgi:16S rRNA (adenine(1408)-N(1))-methyltransferase
VLAAAAAQADRLVVGVDANAAAMATASRRAAAKPSRGGLPNALFVVAAAEALPNELDGVADLVTVHFPWGSLLRGLLAVDPAIMAGLTRVLRPGGSLRLLVSATVRDRGVGVAPLQAASLEALAGSYAGWGLAVSDPSGGGRRPLELGQASGCRHPPAGLAAARPLHIVGRGQGPAGTPALRTRSGRGIDRRRGRRRTFGRVPGLTRTVAGEPAGVGGDRLDDVDEHGPKISTHMCCLRGARS